MGCKSIALDVSPTAIEMGKRLFELDQTHDLSLNPQFLTYDGFTFPMEDQVVDVIISFDAYHHVPNPETILREMFRVLKDKGKIGFCEPGKGHSRSPHAVEEMELYDVFEGEVTYKDLKKLAPKIGFDKIYGPNPVSMIAGHYHWSFIQRFSDSFWPFHRLLANLFKIIILEKGYRILVESLNEGRPLITYLSIWENLKMRHELKKRIDQLESLFGPPMDDEFVHLLPYYTLPYRWITFYGHCAVVYGVDEDAGQVHIVRGRLDRLLEILQVNIPLLPIILLDIIYITVVFHHRFLAAVTQSHVHVLSIITWVAVEPQ